MDETTLDPEYLKQLKPSFLHLFMNFVKPCNVISLFHKYNINVLTEIDLENIKALSDKKGEREGSMLLFERLVLYKGWYACLLQVLCDRDVCLSHVAYEMEVMKGLLEEQILIEQSDDQTQTTVQWLAGMSMLTSGLTTVLRVTPHSSNLNKLKVYPILEMRSLKLKIENARLKTELEEVKQNLIERNQSYEQQHLEANSVLSSDSSDVDQLAGKMCELCKSSKEMLKQNEILQTELREAYIDSKASCEKLNQEKEVLQAQLDHLKKELSDRKDSYENLRQEKEKLQTELDHLKKEFSDRNDSYENLHQENEKLQTELDHLKKEFSDRNDSYENLHQEKEKLQTELDHLKKEFSDRNDSYENLHREKEKLQTELDNLKKEFSYRKDSYGKLHQGKGLVLEFEDRSVLIEIFAKGLQPGTDDHHPKNGTVYFDWINRFQGFDTTIKLVDRTVKMFVKKMPGKIVKEKSTWHVEKDKVVIRMKKAVNKPWGDKLHTR